MSILCYFIIFTIFYLLVFKPRTFTTEYILAPVVSQISLSFFFLSGTEQHIYCQDLKILSLAEPSSSTEEQRCQVPLLVPPCRSTCRPRASSSCATTWSRWKAGEPGCVILNHFYVNNIPPRLNGGRGALVERIVLAFCGLSSDRQKEVQMQPLTSR